MVGLDNENTPKQMTGWIGCDEWLLPNSTNFLSFYLLINNDIHFIKPTLRMNLINYYSRVFHQIPDNQLIIRSV